ncbi:MAG: hypothetical protein JXN64_06795 [Spirochaetes bacterium]|nr:hypothetical protein [Spirochaetota bacterium]
MNSIITIFIFTAGVLLSGMQGPEMMMRGDYNATSQLKEENRRGHYYSANVKYGVQNLFDGKFSTAWVEGVKGYGIGEAVFVIIPDDYKIINIFNGYGKSMALFKNNGRVRRIKLIYHAGINPEGYVTEIAEIYKSKKYPKEYFIDLKDTFGVQTFDFPFSGRELAEFKNTFVDEYKKMTSVPIASVKMILKIEIIDVYKGAKFEDTCISEIFFNDKFVCDTNAAEFTDFNKLYVDDSDSGRVKMDTSGKEGIVILRDKKSVFQIAEVSKDKKWASIIRMPAHIAGRAETEYLLLNINTGRIVNAEIETTCGIRLSNFLLTEKDGITILEHSKGEIKLFEGIR